MLVLYVACVVKKVVQSSKEACSSGEARNNWFWNRIWTGQINLISWTKLKWIINCNFVLFK